MLTQGSTSSSHVLLQMDLRPSRLLLVSLVVTHLLAMLAAVLADFHIMLCFGCIVSLVLGCHYCCKRQSNISYLQMGPGDIMLRKEGQMIAVTLESAPWCNEWLQVLRFRPLQDDYSQEGKPGTTGAQKRYRKRRLSVVILPDSACPQSRRRLRVLLRWHSFAGGVPV